MIRQLDRLQADPEIAAPDAAARQDLVNHPVDGAGRNGETGDAREGRGRDTQRFARGVDDEATGGAGVEREVETNVAVETAAAPRPPTAAHGADDSHSGVDA